MLRKMNLMIVGLLIMMPIARAELVRETVNYKQGETDLEGYLVYDNNKKLQRSAVLVVHEWMGLNDYAKSRADQLAQMGYVAFAADIYGKGVRPTTVDEAGKTAGKYKADRALLRARVLAALDQIKHIQFVDPTKIAAIGYCFGGTTVLELARSGSDVKGVVSFHGGLSQGNIPDEAFKTKLLVLHGGDDPFVPAEEVKAFKDEMKAQQADYQFISYKGAVHGFTNPNNQGAIPGALYNKEADAQSWLAMQEFFKSIGLYIK